MTSRALAALALLALATPALADGETRPLAAEVDFSKPPNKVEAYNKVRITCQPSESPDGRSFRVDGQAYYPDGVVIAIVLRHGKQTTPFARAQAVVSQRHISATLGPLKKTIPGGELVAEAWFVLSQQTASVVETMTKEKYFSCTPPCRWDQRSATRVTLPMGGADAQARDEALEKTELARLIDSLTAAATVAEGVLVSKERPTPAQAQAALDALRRDLDAASATWSTWRAARMFPLFPQRAADAESLAGSLWEVARRQAAAVGLTVAGLPDAQAAFREGADMRAQTRARVDTLRGFLAETGTLDREWRAQNDAAQHKFDESQGAAPATPATPGRR
jgi:hypothetical protein